MAQKTVFDFDDYKAFLAGLEQERAYYSRGFRSRLAEEIGCNNAFISQVLNSSANFSLEQALKISGYLKLKPEEERYFLFLVEYGRAGTSALRERFKAMLEEIRDRHLNIKGRVKQQEALSVEAQSVYYSQWYYVAIHMLVTVPHFRSTKAMGAALKLSAPVVEKAVAFLMSCGLIIEKNGELIPGPSYLHLDRDSPHIARHHTNLRMLAINSFQDEKKSDVHYSTISTLSKKDAEVLRAKLVQEVQNYVQTVSQSKEEAMYCFNLDFFKLAED